MSRTLKMRQSHNRQQTADMQAFRRGIEAAI